MTVDSSVVVTVVVILPSGDLVISTFLVPPGGPERPDMTVPGPFTCDGGEKVVFDATVSSWTAVLVVGDDWDDRSNIMILWFLVWAVISPITTMLQKKEDTNAGKSKKSKPSNDATNDDTRLAATVIAATIISLIDFRLGRRKKSFPIIAAFADEITFVFVIVFLSGSFLS